MEMHAFVDKMFSLAVILGILSFGKCNQDLEENDKTLFKIEGKVMVPQTADQEWISSTRILVDGGQYLGFLKSDGNFVVNNVPSGSYILEVANPSYVFEPTRVDINSKGKFRARRLNNLQPSAVQTVTYPLKFKARGKANYFQAREQWRLTDMLFNPMIMMMFLPLIMLMVLPKLMNTADPETQREMQQSMNMLTNPKQNMPDISETLTNWLGGGSSTSSSSAKKTSKPKALKKKQQ